MKDSTAAIKGVTLQKTRNQVIADFGRSVESEFEWCPAGMIENLELFKMASKMVTP